MSAKEPKKPTIKKQEITTKKLYLFNNNLDIGTRDTEVIELQKRLKEEGYFTYPYFTEYYGPVTRKAVLDYQLAKGVISSPYDTGAGRLGPGTRRILNS